MILMVDGCEHWQQKGTVVDCENPICVLICNHWWDIKKRWEKTILPSRRVHVTRFNIKNKRGLGQGKGHDV
ncbi:hypothetical protein Hanom_Chr00s006190g01732931 [Helianthus anomalus]